MSNTSAHNIADCAANIHGADRCTDDHFPDRRSNPLAHQFITNIGTHKRAHTDSNSSTECGAVYSAICYAECSTNCCPIHHAHHITDLYIPVSCTECATVSSADERPNHLAIGYTYDIPECSSIRGTICFTICIAYSRTHGVSDSFTEYHTIYCTDCRPNHHAIGHPHFIADRESQQWANIDPDSFTECVSVHHTTTNVGTNHFGTGSGRRMLGADAHWLLRNSKQWQWHV
jgi:hypothetical protein